jgi:diaminohydroxyphosphoribosylaminopyrimidine deaminase/5-amino-6-(5-phosphoribosylamino)uracil reductase
MQMALEQARLGVGLTSPNPPVGAVIVANGEVIGRGYHRKAGMPHAEVEAIIDARAHYPEPLLGATIYVTLEPCSTHGRTGPCTEAIRAAGIRRVVWGADDPNPNHAGRARAVLAAAGIAVANGVLKSDCEDLIRPFAKWVTTGLPYVIAKAGQSLDGRITRPAGEGQWITSEAARAHARTLRRQVDAILVGAETVRKDNPNLTLRDGKLTGKEQPLRVVLTRSGNLPMDAHLFTDAFKDRTLVLRDQDLPAALRTLGQQGVVSVLIEGGGKVLAQAFRGRLVDEVYWYIAPLLCGSGVPAVDDPWGHSVPLTDVKVLPIEDNVCINGRPSWPNKKDDHDAPRPAVFFDRDGVVNESPGAGYVVDWQRFEFRAGIVEALQMCKQRGLKTILVTSQQGVGKGLMTQADLDEIHARMQDHLAAHGCAFDGIYACTCLETDPECTCRKPSPEMIEKAVAHHHIDLLTSWLVGDADRDIQMAMNAGITKTIRIESENPHHVKATHNLPDARGLADLLGGVL